MLLNLSYDSPAPSASKKKTLTPTPSQSDEFQLTSHHSKRKSKQSDQKDEHQPSSHKKKAKVSSQKSSVKSQDEYDEDAPKVKKEYKKKVVKPIEVKLQRQEVGELTEQDMKTTLPKSEKVGSGWIDFGLSEKLARTLTEFMKFEHPTGIQRQAIPALLRDPPRDVLIKSRTGSGKTLAFLIPIAQIIQAIEPKVSRSDGVYAVIISPTRELCLQTLKVAQTLLHYHHHIVPCALMGGEKMKAEKGRLRKGANILIATPGRLLDHLQNTQCLQYNNLRFLVLDEADRLLDLGFEPKITEIIQLLEKPKHTQPARTLATPRQNILASATLEKGVQKLANTALVEPISVGFDEGVSSESVKAALTSDNTVEVPVTLEQYFVRIESRHRLVGLGAFIRKCIDDYAKKVGPQRKKGLKAVIFFSTCASVDFHYDLFSRTVWPPNNQPVQPSGVAEDDDAPTAMEGKGLIDLPLWKLHGNLPQVSRTETYNKFCKAAGGVLFCTDVAARGLDLPAVDWIVQYDPPELTQDYVHRVGRTARLGRMGQAALFLLPSEIDYIRVLRQQGLSLTVIGLDKILAVLNYPNSGTSPPAAQLQRLFQQLIAADNNLKVAAQNAFQSYIRAYSTYPKALKSIFHVKNLHTGHAARGFGLNQTPVEIAAILRNSYKASIAPSKPTSKSNVKGSKKGKPSKNAENPQSGSGKSSGGKNPDMNYKKQKQSQDRALKQAMISEFASY